MAAPVSDVRPLAQIQNQPIMTWNDSEVLAYASYIKDKMSTWEKCMHTTMSGKLEVYTTPNPDASITIVDALSKKVLFRDPPLIGKEGGK